MRDAHDGYQAGVMFAHEMHARMATNCLSGCVSRMSGRLREYERESLAETIRLLRKEADAMEAAIAEVGHVVTTGV